MACPSTCCQLCGIKGSSFSADRNANASNPIPLSWNSYCRSHVNVIAFNASRTGCGTVIPSDCASASVRWMRSTIA